MARRPSGWRGVIEALGAQIIASVESVGGMMQLAFTTFRYMVVPPYRVGLLFEHMDFIGVGSVTLVALTGLFTGAVFAKQTIYAFSLFRAQSLVGPTVALTLTRELGPVLTSLMVTMRAGSAICTELGTMRVTEQIDALSSLAVNPPNYLISPRVLAALFMVPALCVVFDGMGMVGGYGVVVFVERLSAGTFLSRVQGWVDPEDLFDSVTKAAVFGLIVVLIACFKGYNARGGSKGVGRATTEAMVMSAMAIFFADYVLDLFLVGSAKSH